MSDWLAAGGVAEALDALAMAARLDPGGGFSFPLQCGAHPQTAMAAPSREQAEAIEQYKRELQKHAQDVAEYERSMAQAALPVSE